MNEGWIGITSQVLHYLGVVGADRDEEGKFIVSGGLYSFLGMAGENAEVVIDSEAKYYINGRPCGLAAGMRSTSYGVKVTVIA